MSCRLLGTLTNLHPEAGLLPSAGNTLRAYVSLDFCNIHNNNVALDSAPVSRSEYTRERAARAGGSNGIKILLLYPVIASDSVSSIWVVQTGAELLRNAFDEVNGETLGWLVLSTDRALPGHPRFDSQAPHL